MKLSEIMKDSKIKIHASINGHGILLITKAAIGVRDGLLVDSLTYFDEDLEFRTPTRIVAVNKRDGRTYEYESQSIGPVTTKYGKFHLIRCPVDGTPVNRRQSERYDIDKLGVIRINGGGDMRNALIYDLSMKGIAFIPDSDVLCKKGDRISISFQYDSKYFHFYTCEATVVRLFSLDNKIAVGCRIDTMGADMITLISNKKKEADGMQIDDFLGISDSADSSIASGEKIPVNYVPPMQTPVSLSEETSPQEALSEDYLSPEEAADLIPDKSEAVQHLAQIEYIDELNSIEDRTPQKKKPEPAKKERLKVDPSKTLANAANPAGSSAHLPSSDIREKSSLDDSFSFKKGEGFLTPDEIADILKLERIHRGE